MVVVTIHGKVIDPNYTALLIKHQELPFADGNPARSHPEAAAYQ